ncbi:hypothetical protein EVJ24_03565 [Exiguobacterium sp. SH1S21]|uniref:hypothetical protein n=1 Tax=Exiguobacterium sp. SH1S21 TaxID=2510953 RepID=UPI00103EF940|nr:hypothetical protein [Exiguobacterium sp. SH1S21]TCI56270.1 hypothetical protein EVJ24_03565 [Exiguobacterium sp. SH1S21]
MSDSTFKKRLMKATHLHRSTKGPKRGKDESRDETRDTEAFERRLREAKSKVGEIQENIDHISRR